jgi:NhaA family Na+:H+ antiporter
MNLKKLFSDFFESEKAGGLLFVAATLISLFTANSAVAES